ncbi:MAG: hypothetical protein JWO13_314 [Acidobacteriales bacterium]|nr:hypothetical protein [Terriglobales bacterium]
MGVVSWRTANLRQSPPGTLRKSDAVLPTTQVPNARVQKHGFLADVFMSRDSSGSIFHYIIQKDGAAEILYWGQEHSLRDALERIQEYLADARMLSA